MRRHNYSCFFYLIFFLSLALMLTSCKTLDTKGKTAVDDQDAESTEEIESALGSVVSAISGKDIKKDELRDLGRSIQKDEEARSAAETLTDSLTSRGIVKYCPIDGERYSSKLSVCPIHNVPLKVLEE